MPDHNDLEALGNAGLEFRKQLMRQKENSARLQEIGGQLQLCMVAMERGQLYTDARDRLAVATIVIKHMTQFNTRTSSYAATMGAGVEQLITELKENEDRMATKIKAS